MKLVIPARRLLLAAAASHPRASSSLLRRAIPALLPRVPLPPLSATASDRVQQACLLPSTVAEQATYLNCRTETRIVPALGLFCVDHYVSDSVFGAHF